MKYLAITFLLAASPAMAETCHYEKGDVEHSMPGCPKDVEKFISLEGICSILPGEIGGEDKKADDEVSAEIERLDCPHLACKRDAIRKKYEKNTVVAKQLDIGITGMNDDDTYWKTEKCEKK